MSIIGLGRAHEGDPLASMAAGCLRQSALCLRISGLMQVATGMHNIRAAASQKQQTVKCKSGGGGESGVGGAVSLKLHELLTNCAIDQRGCFGSPSCFKGRGGGSSLKNGERGIKGGEGARELTKGFLFARKKKTPTQSAFLP